MPVDFSPPRSDLSGFPSRTIRTGTRLFRIHHANLGPGWFSSFAVEHFGGGRFDLIPPRGTSYWALRTEAAFLETIARRPITMIPLELLDRFHMSTTRVPDDFIAANSPVQRARGFGLTAEFHTTTDFVATRTWANALDAAGFAALISIPRHDVTGKLRAVALFGSAGEHQPFTIASTTTTGPIPSEVIDAMAAWGIRCLPIPFDVETVAP